MIRVDGEIVYAYKFPDNTFNVKLNPTSNSTVRIIWNYKSEEELVLLSYITQYYKAKLNDVHLYMPYVPNARMDRVKNSTELFSLKYFANIINGLEFNSVVILDPHSNVCQALFNRCMVVTNNNFVNTVINSIKDELDNFIFFFPDEGAMKRYSTQPCFNGIPYAYGVKDRDWTTGKIKSLSIVNKDIVYGRDIIIVDDICSYGGTFYNSALELKSLGANKIYLAVTHCEDSILNGRLIDRTDLINHIYTTSSIDRVRSLPKDRVTILELNGGDL